MYTPDAPSLPSAAPLTAAAAARWRAARTAWRLDSRWLAVVPLGFLILAAAVEPDTGGVCNAQGICRDSWGESLAIWTVLAETVLLLARPRIRPLVPIAALALFWYVPNGLVTPVARWSAVLLHVLLAAVLIGADLGRRKARQQLDELMAPPVAFPWTAAGAPSPVRPDGVPVGRRVLGCLLLVVAATLPLYGLWEQQRQEERDAAAVRVTGTAGEFDQDGLLTVHYQAPSARDVLKAAPAGSPTGPTATLDVWWAERPKPGQSIPLLLDGDQVRAEGDDYDPSGQLVFGGLIALPGLLLLGSALAHDARRRRPGFVGAAPALAVRVRADARGDLLVLPVDGPPDGPALWRLKEWERYYWARDGHPDLPEHPGPGWLPEHPDLEGNEEDYPEPVLRQDPDEDEEEYGELVERATPEQAAAWSARAARSVPAVLYRGPDGPDQQLLFRPALLDGDPHWVAAVVAPAARSPRLTRQGEHYRERELAVRALSARTLADAPAAGPDTERLPALRWELPLPVRALTGPLAAVLIATAVVLLGDSGWWSGLVRPLWIGSMAVFLIGGAASWQLVADRDGLRVASAFRVRQIQWRQIGAAAVHRGRLTIRLHSGEEIAISTWLMAALAGHFGERYDPARLARTVALAAHRPDLRPAQARQDRLGSPQHLLNRLSVAGYAVFTVAHYLL
ncbi:hypothetical protein [Streptomyces rubellomurinus]|uniref:Uncharacterized protein n=1 Tax=Streptomyces sp. Y1 TaxID=3238634 RepID=A0AB39TNC3_9ACTN|nr:hypothetical protein VM98_18040 [Streptomyces rubellomurinus subsp. indigoferus]